MPECFQLQRLPWAAHSGSLLEAALSEGWEPFAVTEEQGYGRAAPIVWLKRCVSQSLTNEPASP